MQIKLNMENPVLTLLKNRDHGREKGIYSCCSANEFVIRSALRRAKANDTVVLVEATANQVNQNGGYTGMNPADFRAFLNRLAAEEDFPADKVLCGGDHLGPLTWQNLPEEQAMINARELIRAYVLAGFSKIHIDTSMRLANDDRTERLPDIVIARRGAVLCSEAEQAFEEYLRKHPDAPAPVYVIGSEVPIPGGAQENENCVTVTTPDDCAATIETFHRAFLDADLGDAWNRVIAVVVQPGVEFADESVICYDRPAARELTNSLGAYPGLVFEGHSTDYQPKECLRQMVEDGISILKVGPALTFALREGLFALEQIERELYVLNDFPCSNFRKILEQAMLEDNKQWAKYYHGTMVQKRYARAFSYSDRARYYLTNEKVQSAIYTLLNNQNPGKSIHFAWVVLVGVCIVMGLSRGGINNVGGLFMAPVMEELGCGAGEFMLYFTTSSLVTFIFLPYAGKLITRYDIRLLLVTGLILQAGAFALFGFMHTIVGWYILSIPMAIGSVFTTQITGPILIGNWFKKHNGLAVGIMMAAVGLIGAIMQTMTGSLITCKGWRYAYTILGILVMAVGIPVVLLTICMNPGKKGLLPLGGEEQTDKDACSGKELRGVTVVNARKSYAFWAFVLFMFFITAVASFSQHLPKYADQLGYDTTFAGKAMSFFMIGTLVGALVFGLLSDKIGAKVTAVLALICGIAAIFVIIIWGGRPWLFCTAATFYGFSSSSVGTLGPLLTGSLFGQKEYGGIYATAAMGTALAGMVAPSGYGFIYDEVENYIPVLWAIILLLVICLVCVFLAFIGKRKMKRDGLWE